MSILPPKLDLLDSTYDCHFVFVRLLDGYLTPRHRRDIIETPIESLLDVNGWDLGKTLQRAAERIFREKVRGFDRGSS